MAAKKLGMQRGNNEEGFIRSKSSNGLPMSLSSKISYAYILHLLILLIFKMYYHAYHIIINIYFLKLSIKYLTYNFIVYVVFGYCFPLIALSFENL